MSEQWQIPASFDPEEFDIWAAGYDQETESASGFPFEGYHALLDEIMLQSAVKPGMHILDLGTGTGNLAVRFLDLGCKVWGTDFSREMLLVARQKTPEIAFLEWDLRKPWPADLHGDFDRIVSAYVLHHFDLPQKLDLVGTLLARLKPGGRLILADLAFETQSQLNQARQRYRETWEEEYYWIAAETLPALQQKGWQAVYRQVSPIAGVYSISHENAV